VCEQTSDPETKNKPHLCRGEKFGHVLSAAN